MARSKDSTKDVPVENYRKQIGKQDYKKSKAELKETKAKSLAKKDAPRLYKDILVMVLALAVLVAGLYFALYLLLEKKEKDL